MNKRITALLLALLMLLSFAACKDKAEEEESSDAPVTEGPEARRPSMRMRASR